MKRVGGLRTVGTYSEIYDYLSELYVRCGVQHSPLTNKSLYNLSHEEMVEKLLNTFEEGSRLQICVKQRISNEQEAREHLVVWQQDGFVRFMINGEEWEEGVSLKDVSEIEVVIDRFVVKCGIRERVSDSLRTALDLGKGVVWIKEGREGKEHVLSEVYYCPETQQRFPKLTHSDFNFTLPQGACEGCQGRGGIETVDLDLLSKEDDFERLIEAFPRRTAEIYYKLWKASDQNWNTFFHGAKKKISLNLEIGGEQKKISSQWKGWVTYVHEELHTRGENSRFSGQPYVKWKRCTLCDGERLKKQTRFVYWRDKNLPSLVTLTLSELLAELATWNPTPLLKTLHEHIFSRLQIMQKVGLGYLSLDQEVSSLSTGELHRLQIATHITAKLSGMTYVFDEPMTGLHPQDRKHLITLFKELKDLSNTVIVVEHDLETIQSADWVIELGPKAGKEGGQLIYEGKPKQLPKTPSIYSYSKKFTTYLTIGPFSQNNLKDVQIQVPLNAFVAFPSLVSDSSFLNGEVSFK